MQREEREEKRREERREKTKKRRMHSHLCIYVQRVKRLVL